VFEWFGKISYSPHTKIAEFARYLKDGRLMGSRCRQCGLISFPPRADCARCLSGEFEFQEMSGEGTVLTFTRIDASPAGFEDMAPYVIGVVDLREAGRLLAWFGQTIAEGDVQIGMPVQVVPRIFEERPDIRVYYSLEAPGSTWVKADSR
jgi:uncharacterized OB-fold protein